jgi:hypothetical protein
MWGKDTTGFYHFVELCFQAGIDKIKRDGIYGTFGPMG